ncbi:hypothetical protein AS181_06510 [Gordonia sp. SGD-V-85]|nr:hypothetical protein AS181_06510 [Gordonia sp. SGD-V-85]SCC02710.1 hypothetical protein GA0061091_104209 [Gordonia sp. v-85]
MDLPMSAARRTGFSDARTTRPSRCGGPATPQHDGRYPVAEIVGQRPEPLVWRCLDGPMVNVAMIIDVGEMVAGNYPRLPLTVPVDSFGDRVAIQADVGETDLGGRVDDQIAVAVSIAGRWCRHGRDGPPRRPTERSRSTRIRSE